MNTTVKSISLQIFEIPNYCHYLVPISVICTALQLELYQICTEAHSDCFHLLHVVISEAILFSLQHINTLQIVHLECGRDSICLDEHSSHRARRSTNSGQWAPTFCSRMSLGAEKADFRRFGMLSLSSRPVDRGLPLLRLLRWGSLPSVRRPIATPF